MSFSNMGCRKMHQIIGKYSFLLTKGQFAFPSKVDKFVDTSHIQCATKLGLQYTKVNDMFWVPGGRWKHLSMVLTQFVICIIVS